MKDSIIDNNKGYCHMCGCWGITEKHHCLHGTANRRLADEDGLFVYLCHHCHHTLVHDNKSRQHDINLMREAENSWLDYYGRSTSEFIQRYGKNYL